MLEQAVEAKIVSAVETVTPGLSVVGFWNPALEGALKEEPRSHVGVTVSPRETDAWGQPFVTLHAIVGVFSDQAADPTGAALVTAYTAIATLMQSWQLTEAVAVLSVEGEFTAHGVKFAAGGDCGFDDVRGAWYASIALDIKGIT
jgi:hypothetical protein